MSSHPPVIASPYFAENPRGRKGWWVSAYPERWVDEIWSQDEDFPWSLDGDSLLTPGRKAVIAALQEVAWLIEAERISREECEGDPFDTGFGLAYQTKYEPAIKNANAWRKWGRNEPWE